MPLVLLLKEIMKPFPAENAHFSDAVERWNCSASVSSLEDGHLRYLFANLRRVDGECERVRILILFHQLEVDERAFSADSKVLTAVGR
jgi:hypothetical protein